MRSQSALTTSDSEPEPDITVIPGPIRTYLTRHPDPKEIVFLAEIANSSLRHDRTTKARVYARAGIAVYWIVNLVDEVVEVYTQPDPQAAEPAYRHVERFGRGQSVPLVLPDGPPKFISVDDILP